jgi:hypothetical protein
MCAVFCALLKATPQQHRPQKVHKPSSKWNSVCATFDGKSCAWVDVTSHRFCDFPVLLAHDFEVHPPWAMSRKVMRKPQVEMRHGAGFASSETFQTEFQMELGLCTFDGESW